jgi:GTP-binding protein
MARPVVAIVGRPNVGKSSLFNRLVGEQMAIVEDQPGTTRDRLYGTSDWNGVDFTVIDTGGLVLDETLPNAPELSSEEIVRRTREQAQVAIEEADVILFMVDARSGLTAADEEIGEVLRRSHKPVIIAANKAENEERRLNAVEFYRLGLGDPIAISAHHAINTGDLLDEIVAAFPADEPDEDDEDTIRIAIVGRPNVGKSRLLNAILGQERVIVSDVPGTTRDAIDTRITVGEGDEGREVVLIDTAGIRRRGRIEVGVEKYSVIRTLRAITRSDVVLMLIDATEGMTAQDTHIAGYVLEQYKSMLLLVNKWDLVEKDASTLGEFTNTVREELNFMPYVPILFISAKFGQRVNRVLPTALEIAEQRTRRIPTGQLNKIMKEAVDAHPPPSKPGKWLKLLYATQADINPPTFVFFVNDPQMVHFSYQRYLENQLRAAFGFEGTPIKMVFRTRHEDDE